MSGNSLMWRLRFQPGPITHESNLLMQEAADKIEQLEANLAAERAEVERLESARQQLLNSGRGYMDMVVEERDKIERLRAAIDAFITEVDDHHTPEWASEQAKANGKEPWCCEWCGPADGGWPCVHRMALDELQEARRER